jgi:hypothetical protein
LKASSVLYGHLQLPVLGAKRLIYDNMLSVLAEVVTPVKTGVQKTQCNSKDWIPAFAGMTEMVAPKGPLFPCSVAEKA